MIAFKPLVRGTKVEVDNWEGTGAVDSYDGGYYYVEMFDEHGYHCGGDYFLATRVKKYEG